MSRVSALETFKFRLGLGSFLLNTVSLVVKIALLLVDEGLAVDAVHFWVVVGVP